MVHVTSILGIVLVVVALYFLSTVFPALGVFVKPTMALYVGATIAILLGLVLGAVHREFAEPGAAVKAGKGVGLALVSAGLFAIVLGMTKPTATLAWEQTDVEAARQRALRENRPLLVDFTAAWCAACKELDKVTFAAPEVGAEMGRFVAVKVDATNDDDPKVGATLERFRVVGLPTVLVFDSQGKEAIRYTDFVKPAEFLEGISRVD
jgi:thiol:disulfide interchange protein DsbD